MDETPMGQAEPLCFEAVIFDLDGTLVATDRFWPDAARAGALRTFEELGLQRPIPTKAEWMSMVGMPLEEGFGRVFEDLDPAQRATLLERCVEEEHRLIDEGRAGLLPGTELCLKELAARGVRLGVASNCSQAYLDAMVPGLGLDRWIEEGRCLDSPGIGNKADMVEELLERFGSRSAVMVGDRYTDRDAGWANGLPHVHLARGFASDGESIAAEATLDGLDQLVPLLGRRGARVAALLAELEAPHGGHTLGLCGAPFGGKRALARDLARLLRHRGREVELLELGGRPGVCPDLSADPQAEVARLVDLEAGAAALAAPRAPGAVRIAHGRYLHHPRLARECDRLVHLSVDPDVADRRAQGRDGRGEGPGPRQALHEVWLPFQAALDAQLPPARVADARFDGSNPLA